jgi:hypothetical protein
VIAYLLRYAITYPQETIGICGELMSQSGFPSVNVGEEEKRGFMVEVMGTKQYTKFKEVVKRFSGMCRGHQL